MFHAKITFLYELCTEVWWVPFSRLVFLPKACDDFCPPQAIFIFGFGVPLFINADATHWGKWSVLFVHTLALTAVYCYILFVHYSKWRDKLPREWYFLFLWYWDFLTSILIIFLNNPSLLMDPKMFPTKCSKAIVLQLCGCHVHSKCYWIVR